MGYEVVATETFARELDDVLSYYNDALHAPKAARRIAQQLDEAVKLIAEFPEIAAVSKKPLLSSKKFREWYFGSYALVYRTEGRTLYLEHLFHQRQDYERLV